MIWILIGLVSLTIVLLAYETHVSPVHNHEEGTTRPDCEGCQQ